MTTENRMLRSVGQFLEEHGWKAMVIQADRIQTLPGGNGFNYEFILRFTGAKQPATTARKKRAGKKHTR